MYAIYASLYHTKGRGFLLFLTIVNRWNFDDIWVSVLMIYTSDTAIFSKIVPIYNIQFVRDFLWLQGMVYWLSFSLPCFIMIISQNDRSVKRFYWTRSMQRPSIKLWYKELLHLTGHNAIPIPLLMLADLAEAPRRLWSLTLGQLWVI